MSFQRLTLIVQMILEAILIILNFSKVKLLNKTDFYWLEILMVINLMNIFYEIIFVMLENMLSFP